MIAIILVLLYFVLFFFVLFCLFLFFFVCWMWSVSKHGFNVQHRFTFFVFICFIVWCMLHIQFFWAKIAIICSIYTVFLLCISFIKLLNISTCFLSVVLSYFFLFFLDKVVNLLIKYFILCFIVIQNLLLEQFFYFSPSKWQSEMRELFFAQIIRYKSLQIGLSTQMLYEFICNVQSWTFEKRYFFETLTTMQSKYDHHYVPLVWPTCKLTFLKLGLKSHWTSRVMY